MDELGRHKMFDDGFSTQLARGDNKFKTLHILPSVAGWFSSPPQAGNGQPNLDPSLGRTPEF